MEYRKAISERVCVLSGFSALEAKKCVTFSLSGSVIISFAKGLSTVVTYFLPKRNPLTCIIVLGAQLAPRMIHAIQASKIRENV
jgi:hypothetical protein